jgi:hypothetical protein
VLFAAVILAEGAATSTTVATVFEGTAVVVALAVMSCRLGRSRFAWKRTTTAAIAMVVVPMVTVKHTRGVVYRRPNQQIAEVFVVELQVRATKQKLAARRGVYMGKKLRHLFVVFRVAIMKL